MLNLDYSFSPLLIPKVADITTQINAPIYKQNTNGASMTEIATASKTPILS